MKFHGCSFIIVKKTCTQTWSCGFFGTDNWMYHLFFIIYMQNEWMLSAFDTGARFETSAFTFLENKNKADDSSESQNKCIVFSYIHLFKRSGPFKHFKSDYMNK